MRTVRDWYLDAEDSGFHPPASRSGQAPRAPRPRSRSDDADALSDEFIATVLTAHADRPALTAVQLAAGIRRSGWCHVEPRHVTRVLSAHRPERPALPAQRPRPPAPPSPVPPVSARLSAVRHSAARHSAANNAARPSDRGSARAGNAGRPSEGRAARAGNAGRHTDPGPARRANAAMPVGRERRVPAQPDAEPVICAACGVRVSLLGWCKCS